MRAMKTLLCSAVLAITSLAVADTAKMKVTMSGTELGTARITIAKTPDRGFTIDIKMEFDIQGQNGTGVMKFVYDKNGRPKLQQHSMSVAGMTESEKQTYTATHVLVEKVENGQKISKKIVIPKGRRLEDPSNLWFIYTKPKVGAVNKAWDYDSKTMKFKQETTKYIGPKTIEVSGRQVRAHTVQSEEGSAWLDDKGMPLKLVLGRDGLEMVLERVWN
jgi:hypothetical protein